MPVFAEDPFVVVGTNKYSAFRPDLPRGGLVYVDADPAGATPVRATQRALGYREVDYKSAVYATLAFQAVAPTTRGMTVAYDYSAQANRTNLVGFWVAKNVPVLIAPDGRPYIADGHHTTAGYLAPQSPVRQLVPGKKRVIFGYVLGNYYDTRVGPQLVTDAWWIARASENEALLYGPNGDQLTQAGEPNYSQVQPILPSALAMPASPSILNTNGATAMASSIYRSLAWAMVDAVVESATDGQGMKIAGFKKTAPGSVADIFFVEFFWADFLRHRVVWDDTLSGSPLGSPNADASAIAAPLSFFTATANGIALARSEIYRDAHGRRIFDYTNAAVFSPNTVSWAAGSLSNGLAGSRDTYHLYLRDDSTMAGVIQPSARSTNILHIDTVMGLTVKQPLQNIRTAIINAGGYLKVSWKDPTVTGSTLRLPPGTGTVTVPGTNFVVPNTILAGGVLAVEGTLHGNLEVTNGVLQGRGAVDGAVTISGPGTLAPGSLLGTLAIHGPLTLGGTILMQADKRGAIHTNAFVDGISVLTYGGRLTLTASGDALVPGDVLKLFEAGVYKGKFTTLSLPTLGPGLSWDTTRLAADGTIKVVRGTP